MRSDPWTARFWRAYEWAHNNYHPSGHRLAAFAKSYADAHEGNRTSLPLTDFWEKWQDGKIEERMMEQELR